MASDAIWVKVDTENERARRDAPKCWMTWGSHGCELPKGHDGYHDCGCCRCEDHERDHKRNGCVATFPFYGPETIFRQWEEEEEEEEASRGE